MPLNNSFPSPRRSRLEDGFSLAQAFTPGERKKRNDAPDSDYTGYDFWLTKLNQFNGNFVAAEMGKAFINSTEYRQRFGL